MPTPATLHINSPLVTAEWLYENIENTNLILLNATLPKVTTKTQKKVAFQIPNTRVFDIKNKFSAPNARFPNTIPTERQFTKEAQNLGIHTNSSIVIYDEHGIYSSPRAWWLLQTFGHTKVAVLQGGLPDWIANGFPTELKTEKKYAKGTFTAKLQRNAIVFFEDFKNNTLANATLIDARSKARFNGTQKEPRIGLRSGNLPKSKNLPYTEVLQGTKYKTKEELQLLFYTIEPNHKKKLVFSCGSGITACILDLAANLTNYNNTAVYDGSWTEYGSLTNTNTMHFTKNELMAYVLLYAANTDLEESNKERDTILKHVDMQTFQKVHDEFDADNDYQSIQKIQKSFEEHNFSKETIEDFLTELKAQFFADGDYDGVEHYTFNLLRKLIS